MEAGTNDDAARSSDAADDVDTRDARNTDDAGACDEVATKPRTYCQQYAADWGYAYCRDFDDPDPITFGWDTTTTKGGSFSLDACHRTSLPASLRSRIDGTTAACASAMVAKTVTVGSSFRAAFSGRLRQVSSKVNYFGLRVGGAGCHLVLSGDGASASVLEEGSGPPVAHPLNLRFPLPDVWTRVAIDIDRTSGMMNVQLDGKPAITAPVPLGAACVSAGAVTLEIGLQCVDASSSPAEVTFDDVLVTGGG